MVIFVLILVDMIVLSFQSVEYDWFEFILSPLALFGFEWGAGWLVAALEASSQLFEFWFVRFFTTKRQSSVQSLTMVQVAPDAIIDSGQSQRTIEAALRIQFLLTEVFPNEETCVVLWFAAMVFRGNNWIMSVQNIPSLVLAIDQFGLEDSILFGLLHKPSLFHFPDCPYLPPAQSTINVNNMSATDCANHFCFDPNTIRTITGRLPFANNLSTPTGRDAYCLVEGFCIILFRMAFPHQLCDMVHIFGRHETALSRIF